MSVWRKLFSYRGRIRRLDWWCFTLVLGVAIVPAHHVVKSAVSLLWPGVFEGADADLHLTVVELLADLPFIWIQTALSVKRMHDINWPGWPVAAFQVAVLSVGYLPMSLLPGLNHWVQFGLIGAGLIATVVILGFVPGTRGPNRFGPPTVMR